MLYLIFLFVNVELMWWQRLLSPYQLGSCLVRAQLQHSKQLLYYWKHALITNSNG